MAPVTDTPHLLIVAHGEQGGARDNAWLAAIVAASRALLGDSRVHGAVLSGEPLLETVVAQASAREWFVYPLFMSEGYFVANALPKRLAAAGVNFTVLPALGTHRGFAELAASQMRGAGANAAEILVVAHGSGKDARSRLAAQTFARQLGAALGAQTPDCAFLEEPPFAAEAIAALSPGAVVVSLFAGRGLHGAEDLPRMVDQSGRNDLKIVRPVEDTDAIARIVADALRSASAGSTFERMTGNAC